jgi:hypothetical protein
MVYIIQEQQGKNVLSAGKFGELTYLLKEGSQVTLSAGFVTNTLKSRLSEFNDNDYLVLIGDPVAIGLAVAIACHWNKGRAKLLKWDRQDKTYYPVEINIYQKGESNDGSESLK